MTHYEFSKDEEQKIAALGQRMAIVAIMMGIVGGGRLIVGFLQGFGPDGFNGAVIAFLIIGLLNVGLGITFFRPTDNFKRIATTSGSDIKELMIAFSEMTSGVKLINYLLMAMSILAIFIVFFS